MTQHTLGRVSQSQTVIVEFVVRGPYSPFFLFLFLPDNHPGFLPLFSSSVHPGKRVWREEEERRLSVAASCLPACSFWAGSPLPPFRSKVIHCWKRREEDIADAAFVLWRQRKVRSFGLPFSFFMIEAERSLKGSSFLVSYPALSTGLIRTGESTLVHASSWELHGGQGGVKRGWERRGILCCSFVPSFPGFM